MTDFEYERIAVCEWMKTHKMTHSSDYIAANFTFLKNMKYEYFNSPPKYVDYQTDLMIVTDHLISVNFSSNYQYNPFQGSGSYFSSQNVYSSFFDENWVIATNENFNEVYEKTDKKIGIMIIDTNRCLAVVRHPVVRRSRQMDHYALAGLLTKSVLVDLYAKNNDKQALSQSKEMLRRNAQCVPYNQLISTVISHLKIKQHNRQPLTF